ncbi:MAG TPA: hypothetical protein GX707_07940 [Epulopiscium sp.]|nr:hypothetical protein [Candidatus Epulonipiscium sp.]
MRYYVITIYSLSYIIYFMLFSKELYTGGHIIKLYYPLAILLGIIITWFLKVKIIKDDIRQLILGFTFGITFLILIYITMDGLYGSIISDFYMGGYQNLFQIPEYMQQEDNLVTIHLAKLKEGVFAHNIQTGHQVMANNYIIQRIYFINEKEYIIFDWDKREIINRKTVSEIEQLAHEFIINAEEINKEYFGEIIKYRVDGDGVFFWCKKHDFHLTLYTRDGAFYFRM